MALDYLLNKQILNQNDMGTAVALRDALEYTSDFDFSEHRKLLRSALERADEMRNHQYSLTAAFGITISAYKQTLEDLKAAQERIEKLEEIATTDEMTGLTNRRGFMKSFDKELDRTNRGISNGGLLIMIDLDNFKMINDTYGHAAGDEALKLVSRTLEDHIRKMDVAARLGGDEFVLIFANAGKTKALGRAQNLAVKLNSLNLKWQGHKIPVRASIGVKDYSAGETLHELLSAVDATMYKAKNNLKQLRNKNNEDAK
jgi:diguanylate cyclase (GGDEF)-like protein